MLLDTKFFKRSSNVFEILIRELEIKTHYSHKQLKEFLFKYIKIHQGSGFTPAQIKDKFEELVLALGEADSLNVESKQGEDPFRFFNYALLDISLSDNVLENLISQIPVKKKVK